MVLTTESSLSLLSHFICFTCFKIQNVTKGIHTYTKQSPRIILLVFLCTNRDPYFLLTSFTRGGILYALYSTLLHSFNQTAWRFFHVTCKELFILHNIDYSIMYIHHTPYLTVTPKLFPIFCYPKQRISLYCLFLSIAHFFACTKHFSHLCTYCNNPTRKYRSRFHEHEVYTVWKTLFETGKTKLQIQN